MTTDMRHLFDHWEMVWHEAQYNLVPFCVGPNYIRFDEQGARTVTREAYAAEIAAIHKERPESVNHELIFWQISPLGDPATQSMTSSSHEKCGCTQMPNSNDVARNEMLWERVLSLLVVGASVLGGSAVLLIMALPPVLHGFP
jgi:hypothetical protein